jgi:hypothetical protein
MARACECGTSSPRRHPIVDVKAVLSGEVSNADLARRRAQAD